MSNKNEYTYKGILKTDKYEYTISIDTTIKYVDNTPIIYKRYFSFGSYTDEDGNKKTCVDIFVSYPELQKDFPNANYKIAKLITTHYNERCSVNEKLQRGDGTRHMINTAMYFVSLMCKFIEGFELNDVSTRQCTNNTTITLSNFSITKYGQTWYEKNFGAYILDKNKWDIYTKTMNDLMNKELQDWELFKVLFLRRVNKNIIETIYNIYTKSNTYRELFKNIHAMGMDEACIYLEPWIDELFLTSNLKNYISHTQWCIPQNSIKRVPLVNRTVKYFGKLDNYNDL